MTPITQPRDDFYGICGFAAVLILAAAMGVPALMDAPADALAVVAPAPAGADAGTAPPAVQGAGPKANTL